jgi:4-amino-4-deoxy-L-arabinose transferase-like glycosyltransferase
MKGAHVFVRLGVVLVAIVLVAGMFNPAPHTGGDNAGYISLAHSLAQGDGYQEQWDPEEPPHTKYPPVFPLILAVAMLLGAKSWVSLKMVPVAFTLLSVLFTYLWVRGREGMALAVGIALLVALSDGVLYYSRWILSDPTFLALTLGAFWALDRKEGKPRLAWGFALVVLAYLTRSAGIPLVLATGLWLGLSRRWRALVAFAVAFCLPAGWWWLRGRAVGTDQYVAEFWLLDPYQPDLGRAGVADLLARVGQNLQLYVTQILPEGIVGMEGPFLAPLGMGLVLIALVGWFRRIRENVGVTELFLPLYAGLMLLWPVVWSGDRFALPVLPLLFFYAVLGLRWLLGSFSPGILRGALLLTFLLLAVPAATSWTQEARTARQCATRLEREPDPFGCYPENIREYAEMARWAGQNLPAGSAVVTRKPRIFFVLSGVKTQSLPLTTDPEAFLAAAAAKGSRYVTLDRWDGLAGYYVPPVVQDRSRRFCYVTRIPPGEGGGTSMLGILDTPLAEGAEEGLARCPEDMVTGAVPRPASPPDGTIPLLSWSRD